MPLNPRDPLLLEAQAERLRLQGKDLLLLGERESAFACFREAFALAPQCLRHRLNAAAVHRAEGRAEAVLPLLRPLVPPFGEGEELEGVFWRHLAAAEGEAGEPGNAARCWRELLRLEPGASTVEAALQELAAWLEPRGPEPVAPEWREAAEWVLAGLREQNPRQHWLQALQLDSPLLRLWIRPEGPADAGWIEALHREGFPQGRDAEHVALLRAGGELPLSLVAELDGQGVGHVAFSPATLEPRQAVAEQPRAGQRMGLALAPLAVESAHRRQGIAARLVACGLDAARTQGCGWVVLIGGLHYYGRFGFQPAAAFGLWERHGFGDEFLALELRPGALPAGGGLVRYSPLLEG